MNTDSTLIGDLQKLQKDRKKLARSTVVKVLGVSASRIHGAIVGNFDKKIEG